LETELD